MSYQANMADRTTQKAFEYSNGKWKRSIWNFHEIYNRESVPGNVVPDVALVPAVIPEPSVVPVLADVPRPSGVVPEPVDGGEEKKLYWYLVHIPDEKIVIYDLVDSLANVFGSGFLLQNILALVDDDFFFIEQDDVLFYKVDTPESGKLGVMVSTDWVLTFMLGKKIPRLEMILEVDKYHREDAQYHDELRKGDEGKKVRMQVIDRMRTINKLVLSQNPNYPSPTSISSLVLYIFSAYLDYTVDTYSKLVKQLKVAESELTKGGSFVKRKMIDDERIPNMQTNLDHVTEVIMQGEQNLFKVNEIISSNSKHHFESRDVKTFEMMTKRLSNLKEDGVFIGKRVKVIQKRMGTWQASIQNQQLHNLNAIATYLLPLSIVISVFGMNVGGTPWTHLEVPKNGFKMVLFVSACVLVLSALIFHTCILSSISFWWRSQRI